MKVIIFLLVFLVAEAISFGIAAGLIFLLSLCFSFTFTWKLAFGLWLLFLIIQSIFKPRNNH